MVGNPSKSASSGTAWTLNAITQLTFKSKTSQQSERNMAFQMIGTCCFSWEDLHGSKVYATYCKLCLWFLKKYPNTKLVILGKGEEQSDIVETAERLNIKDNIVYRFDFVSEKERILHYAAADVCVFPSIYEPFGIVSLEAMAMEKPVVVGARGVVGFKEQVVNGGADQNGVHINGEDPADIAWGIKETLRNPEKAKNWGENGRRRVLEYFTWRKVAEETLKIYESLL